MRSSRKRHARALFMMIASLALTTRPAIALAEEDAKPILGFSSGSTRPQFEAEKTALAVPSPENARRWLRTLTAEPHVAGTGPDYKTAVFVRDKLREWGWKADLVELKVLLNYPNPNSFSGLSIDGEEKGLPITEPAIAADNDSGSSSAFGGFHGYSASGSAHERVVYANYGRPEDFTALEKMGIDVEHKIVLVRYGAIFRGLKVQNAQKHGAAGILIFSDPADDGFAKGEVYPAGPYRPGGAIQRGSVQFLSMGPGDPSTPLGPSVDGAERIPFDPVKGLLYDDSWAKRTGIAKEDYLALIPSIPIGYDAAHAILKKMSGPVVPAGWQGGLPLTYHIGPGSVRVSMEINVYYAITPIWNVIATIPGSESPERWVMMGNHRDAWVHGAVDPSSGTAATLETCHALGEAVKKGWKPRRTLVYASWDAEEYGLVGSTEWGETNAKEIDEKAVLMLNVDSAVSGHELDASGVPSLRDLFLDAAGSITDPRTGKPLSEGWIAAKRTAWAADAPLVLADPVWGGDVPGGGFTPQLGTLGSGSDYTVFVDHLGIPCLDSGFKGSYGVYHSAYDDFHWMEKHGDPGFLTHAMAARLYTLIVMRAAAAPVLPFTFTPYAAAMRSHVDELRLHEAKRLRKNESPSTEAFEGQPALIEAVKGFTREASSLDAALKSVALRDDLKPEQLAPLNDALTRVERAFLLEPGLAGRPWFKHAVYAPGLTTGYGAWPLPAIRQVLEDPKSAKLAAEVDRTVRSLQKATAALHKARDQATTLTPR